MINLYFNESQHKYTDDFGTKYTSVTSIISKYSNEFDMESAAKACEKIGFNPSHPKYEKYRGKSAEDIIEEWQQAGEDACEKGTSKHAFIENALLDCTTHLKFDDKMFTIENITSDLGSLDINKFENIIGEKYPVIFKRIKSLHSLGFRFFPELAVFNKELGISGTIDLFCIKDNKFLIIDWKTNRDKIMFDSGYYEKDRDGNRTGEFKNTKTKMKAPLFFMPDSTGIHYSLQISGYAWLAEQFGYKNIPQNLIFQIRDINETEHVDEILIKDYREWAEKMFTHYSKIIE